MLTQLYRCNKFAYIYNNFHTQKLLAYDIIKLGKSYSSESFSFKNIMK